VSTTAESRTAGARDGAAVQTLENAMAEATDPVILRNLRAVAEHIDAEVAGDIERLMATLVGEPIYHIWGASKSVGPQGFDEVRANYQSLIRSGKNRLTYEVTRVVADRRCVITEGHFRLAYPGAVLPFTTLSTGEPVRHDHWYLVEYKCVVLWPMDPDGRILGEELYAGEAPRVIQHLDDGEHPELGPVGRSNGVLVPGWV
jgi:SnoaL-like domain